MIMVCIWIGETYTIMAVNNLTFLKSTSKKKKKKEGWLDTMLQKSVSGRWGFIFCYILTIHSIAYTVLCFKESKD